MHALDPIRTRTLELMRALGQAHAGRPLQDLGWTFRWDDAKRRLGACHTKKRGRDVKLLSLSRPIAQRNGWAVMEDVVRHEIAHALDYEHGGRRGHGPTWKRWARACGADPTRLYEGDLETVPSRYVAVCPNACGYTVDFHRRVSRWYYCPTCTEQAPGDRAAYLHLTERTTGRIIRCGGVRLHPREPDALAAEPAKRRDPGLEGYKYTAVCPNCGGMAGYRRKLKRRRACAACCAAHAGGRFDVRFELDVRQNY